MKSFEDIIKEYEGKPYDELLSLARGALGLIASAFSKFAVDCEPGDLIVPFIFATLGADGELSEKELQFLNDLFGADFGYEDTKLLTLAHSDDEVTELIDQMIDACDDKTKAALLIFCMCFAAVDNTVTYKETAYLMKLFA